MDANEWKTLLLAREQHFADILRQCKDGAFGNAASLNLAVSKMEELLEEILEIQEELPLNTQHN